MNETLHDDLPGHCAHGRRGEPGCKKGNRKYDAGRRAEQWSQCAIGLFNGANLSQSLGKEGGRSHDKHCAIYQARQPHGYCYVKQLKTKQAFEFSIVFGRDTVLSEGRVKENNMGHYRCAKYTGGKEHAFHARKLGYDGVECHLRHVWAIKDRLNDIADGNNADEGGNHGLQRAEAASLETENNKCRQCS